MNSLLSRKQLLIAESDLNRAHLAQDWHAVNDDVHTLARQAGTIRPLASMALTLVSGLVSLRQKRPPSAEKKPSWLQSILKGAQLVRTLWSEFGV